MAEDTESKDAKSNSEPPFAEPIGNKSSAPPPPGQQPYYQKPPFEPRGLAGNKFLFLIIIIGLIMMLIGSILISVVPTIGDVDEDDPKDLVDIEESKLNTEAAGQSLFSVGAFFILMFLFFAGTFREDINQYARLGMFIAAGLVITKFIIF